MESSDSREVSEAFRTLGHIGIVTYTPSSRQVVVDGARIVLNGKVKACILTAKDGDHPAIQLVRKLKELPESAHVINIRGNEVRLVNGLWALKRDKIAQAAQAAPAY